MAGDKGFRDSILIIVDHANNFIPSKYKNLGLLKNLTESHIAYDLNILNLSKRINVLLESDIVYGEHSRLIIDLNRGQNDPTLIPSISDFDTLYATTEDSKLPRITLTTAPYQTPQ